MYVPVYMFLHFLSAQLILQQQYSQYINIYH